jgi:hypothetical protein
MIKNLILKFSIINESFCTSEKVGVIQLTVLTLSFNFYVIAIYYGIWPLR